MREEKVVVRLNEQIKNDFQAIAEEHGITMSALAAFIIGGFVRQQKTIVAPMNEQIMQIVGQTVQKAVQDAKNAAESA